jgi:hypothetical protein
VNAVVFTNVTASAAFEAAIDVVAGYPRTGRRANGGIHGPGGDTTTYKISRKHPRRNEWAYDEDGAVLTYEARGVSIPPTASRQNLDTSWDPDEPPARIGAFRG